MRIGCLADGTHVSLLRDGGRAIHDNDRLLVVTIASPTLSGNVAMAAPADGIGPTDKAPVVREVVEDWFRQPGHQLQGQHGASSHRMEFANRQSAGCVASLSLDRKRINTTSR